MTDELYDFGSMRVKFTFGRIGALCWPPQNPTKERAIAMVAPHTRRPVVTFGCRRGDPAIPITRVHLKLR